MVSVTAWNSSPGNFYRRAHQGSKGGTKLAVGYSPIHFLVTGLNLVYDSSKFYWIGGAVVAYVTGLINCLNNLEVFVEEVWRFLCIKSMHLK